MKLQGMVTLESPSGPVQIKAASIVAMYPSAITEGHYIVRTHRCTYKVKHSLAEIEERIAAVKGE